MSLCGWIVIRQTGPSLSSYHLHILLLPSPFPPSLSSSSSTYHSCCSSVTESRPSVQSRSTTAWNTFHSSHSRSSLSIFLRSGRHCRMLLLPPPSLTLSHHRSRPSLYLALTPFDCNLRFPSPLFLGATAEKQL